MRRLNPPWTLQGLCCTIKAFQILFWYVVKEEGDLKTIKSFSPSTHRIWYLLAALVALVVSDGLITHFLVNRGLGQEGNPFLQTLVGETNFLVIKVLGVLLCALILWDIHRRRPKLALISSWCFVVLYAGIVLWNLCAFFISQV
jgi:hypothetical protein